MTNELSCVAEANISWVAMAFSVGDGQLTIIGEAHGRAESANMKVQQPAPSRCPLGQPIDPMASKDDGRCLKLRELWEGNGSC